MTLREVATRADVSVAYLSDLERAELTNPTLDKLRAIAAAVEVPIDALVGEPEQHTSPGPTSGALTEFAKSSIFRESIFALAERWRRDPEELTGEWLALLDHIRIGSRRPVTSTDYLFIFEAIRRALEGGSAGSPQ